MWTAAMAFLALLAAAQPSSSQQLAIIRVAGPPSEPLKTVYYAERAGIFRKYGLDVQVTQVNNGSAAMAAVAGGSVDLAHAALLSAMQAYLRGVRFVIVAPSGLYESEHPQAATIVKRDAQIRTGRDLDGKVIASSSLQDLNAAVTLGWVDAHGGDSKTVQVIELTNSAILPAILDGRVAAATVTEPYLDMAAQSGSARVLGKAYDVIAKRFMVSGYIGTLSNVEQKKDEMHRFAMALHDSIEYTNSHPAQMVDLVASYTGLSPDALRKTTRTVDPEYVEARYIQPVIAFAAKYGLLSRTFDANEIISDVAVKAPR